MRICEPFGPELRKGLWLYHILEPEPWSRACARGRPWCKVCSPRVAVFWSAEAGKTGPPYVAELCLTACRSRWRNITGPKWRCTSTDAGGASVSLTKNHHYWKYMARLKRQREEWGLI